MKRLEDPEVAAWLDKSGRDLRMARMAMEDSDPMWDQACFHAQQAAEKSLKGLLVAIERDVPRTHDLRVVLEPLVARDGCLEPHRSALAELANTLTPHGVAPRYPSFLPEETEEDARTALRAAEAIVARVNDCLAASSPPGPSSSYSP